MSAKTGSEVQRRQDLDAGSSVGASREVAPGKQTLTGSLAGGEAASASSASASVQLKAGDWSMSPGLTSAMGFGVQLKADDDHDHDDVQAIGQLGGPDVAATAERGVAGASSELPHADTIQQAFGKHDVSGVRAQVGGEAADASKQLGAQAYATGDRVAFAQAPDLHTAAHEAAHVVQQAAGVHLKDGLGQVGDSYEQHADAVADAVVAGKSAEGLLDGFASPSSAKAGGDVQKKAVQLVAAVYKSGAELKAMTLSQFDSYANAQADWATSATLGTDKEPLRSLLGLARKGGGLVLGACGSFNVQAMIAIGAAAGSGTDTHLTTYSRAASVGKNAGTIHVQARAADPAEALSWGEAIGKLERGIHGLIIEKAIPQNGSSPCLKDLVDGGAIDDLIKYYKDVKPLLDSENGADINSYLAFRGEGGQGKYMGYKGSIPEVRNYHRFTVPQLDGIALNRANAKTNKAQTPPLPICVVLQTAFDHNGAFHRDPYMTTVIQRVTHLTLFAEGKPSLAAFSTELANFAAYGKDGKVDEVMIAGHGNAKLMELAGDKGVGTNRAGTQIYGTASDQPVTVDQRYPAGELADTDTFIASIAAVLRDDPNSRVVLNACLTASNSVDGLVLDADPDKAAKQVRDAIAKDPSLATSMKTKLGANQAQVRGANASFGQVSLLDPGGNIDIISPRDPKLTAPKLEYAEGGTEPTGVLRATLESWATDRVATIAALNRRIAAKGASTNWSERVICAVMKIIVADKDNGQLISTLTDSAGTLGHLTSRPDCHVSSLQGKVPGAHMNAIFTDLTGTALWADAGFQFVPAVVFQVWCAHNAAKIPAFLSFLNGSSFNTLDADDFLDRTHMKTMLAQLLPTPGAPATPPRGSFLIALLYLANEGAAAPQLAKDYIKAVVGVGSQAFPATCNVGVILQGASEQSVLESAGVVAKASAPVIPPPIGSSAPIPTGPTPNLAPTGAGNNTLAVDSVTMKCETHGLTSTNAYMLPTGNKIGTIPTGTILDIIGKTKGDKKGFFTDDTDVDYFAVDHAIGTNKTVFVPVADVHLK